MVQTGKPADPMVQKILSSGNGLMRPLEAAAKKAGVQILLEHKMTAIFRETPTSGRVLGIAADNNGTKLNIVHAKRLLSRPVVRPVTSTSAACSTLDSPRNTADWRECHGRTRMPAANSPA